MRKFNLISPVLSLFLLVPASITRAQTISSQKGLTTAVFPTQYGNVKVYLPDDIRPGDVISGTVIAEPKGNNARQTEKNLAELVKYTVSIDGNKYTVAEKHESFQWLVNKDRQVTVPLELLNAAGVRAHELKYNIRPVIGTDPVLYGCAIPSHALTAAPARIAGSFDGDMSNTQCLLNNQPTQILAESPRQCILQYPENGQGQKTMQVNENGEQKCTRQISGVDMQVTTGDLNLRKGQNTYIDVKVTGLQNLPDKAVLTIINTTPNVVTMTNGNQQVIPIWPPADSAQGTFSVHCPAVSITTGNFVVEINLDLPQPSDTPTPTTELPPGYTKKSCSCGASVTVSKTGNSFKAMASPACTGVYGIGINTFCVCSVSSTSYKWTIKSGQENVELVGKTDGPNVNVRPKNSGSYTVCVTATVGCVDGSACTATACANQSGETVVPKPPDIPKIPVLDSIPTTDTIPTDTYPMICIPDVKEQVDPKMVGGLKSKQTGPGSTNIIFRDDFVALEAVGSDVDLVKFLCIPPPPCPDSKSEKTIAVAGKVRFEWKITAGDGRFVKLGCGSEDEKKDKGEHVIFQPPYVALPVKNPDTSVLTTIELMIIDDGSPVTDAPVIKIITIKTTRRKTAPDKYTVDISGGLPDKPEAPVLPVIIGTCELVGPTWKPGDNLAKPEIILPGVADASKMVLGQWIILKTQDQSDPDPISFNCSSKNCSGSGSGKTYPDNILWEWEIVSGGGRFILGNKGQFVIYEADPDSVKGKEIIEVKIKVKVMNPGGERKDPDKSSDEFTLYIYQPGVKLSHPDLTWLPEEDNSLELKSELMYKSGGKWMTALAHMCRIHYFELVNVSTEKGVCLNAPVPKDADDCRDLKLKKEGKHEAFDETKGTGKCDKKDMYQQARTQKPEKVYSISIYSLDFGSYGFLRSFANVNKKTSLEGEPVYVSIPVKKDDEKHPNGRAKKTVYPDNRVTIPHDIDENRIADGGWTSTGDVDVPDPADNKADTDDKPTGDSFKGDGFTTYEEYRGFKVSTKSGVIHQRTNHEVKDIFVQNESKLPIKLYDEISELDAHEITPEQYISHEKRFVNFNFNKTTHLNYEQRGLHLKDHGSHSSLLGIAYSTTGQPTVPNAEIEIKVFTTKIKSVVNNVNKKVPDKDKLIYADKLAGVVAHELLHGNNVCHHGEGNHEVEGSFDAKQGLRSGNVDCVMRYDNAGTPISKIPEKPGTDLCTSAAGTGFNAGGQYFGNAATGRGNCKGQIRVSGAGGIPKTCGNR